MAMNVGGCMLVGGEEVWARGERRWAIGIECWATTAALQIIIARTISTQAIPVPMERAEAAEETVSQKVSQILNAQHHDALPHPK
jgi:hypothetical protein